MKKAMSSFGCLRPLLLGGVLIASSACSGASNDAAEDTASEDLSGSERPCDIYASGETPCVAAHSTIRALYGSYDGSLYRVRRDSDHTTKDIRPLSPGGYADSASQDKFCEKTSCQIMIIFDQSPKHNDLAVSPPSHWLPKGGDAANAGAAKIKVAGHDVYGVYVTSGNTIAYRNDHTNGVATGNEAESMYMVVDGKRHSSGCCFDYGNAETNGSDDGGGTMEALYWGTDTHWGGQGRGDGPWIAADLENGMYKCDVGGPIDVAKSCPKALADSIDVNFATAILKGPADDTFALKSGNAESGSLVTQWNGPRPPPFNGRNGKQSYSPKKLQGAIILGTGGDGSHWGTGTFFEGAMTAGNPTDAIDERVQANIVAAGYGK